MTFWRVRPGGAWKFLLAGAILLCAYPLFHHRGLTYDLWYQVFGVIATGAILLGLCIHAPRARGAWIALALGQLAFVFGDSVFSVAAARGTEVAFPGISDAFYLSGYPLIGLGIALLLRSQSRGRDWDALVDAAIFATGVGAVAWVFLMEPYANDASMTIAARLVSIAYPLMDLLIVAVAARFVLGNRWRNPAFILVACALLVQLAGDAIYGLVSIQGLYADGDLVDLSWPIAYLCWGAAALHPSMARLTEPVPHTSTKLGPLRLGLLSIATLLAPLMMVLQAAQGRGLALLVTAVAAIVLFGLVVIRFAGIIALQARAARRERALREAAAALVAAPSRQEIVDLSVAAAVSLTDGAHPWAAFIVHDGSSLTVVSTAGECPLGPSEIVAEITRALESDMEVRRAGRSTFAVRVEMKDEQLGVLALSVPSGLPADAINAVETLAAQLAMALVRVALSEAALKRQSAERFRALVQNSSDIILVLDPDLTIRYHTPSVQHVLSYGVTELVGADFAGLVDEPDTRDALELLGRIATRPGASASKEISLRKKNGGARIVELVASNLLEDENVNGIVVTGHDVTDRKALAEQLSYQAFHDALTGLANRALFHDRVSHALQRRERNPVGLAVLFLDLDDFKTVNDSLGHGAGDAILIEVAERISTRLRIEDTCARLGGDEFAILLEGAEVDDAERIAEQILDILSAPIESNGTEVHVHASIGIAQADEDSNADTLLRDADAAMYRAKATGKSRIELFDPAMREDAVDRLRMRAALQRAINDEMFILHYQPIVDLSSGEVRLCEALVRWVDSARGLIPPDDFIPLAEETGLIVPIGRWVLREACRRARDWLDPYDPTTGPGVSVNLSPRQLQDPNLVADVEEALRDTGLPADKLILEITETVLMTDVEAMVDLISRFKRMGVQIAIDDFGTGYSSLSYLGRFPVDILKIAKTFIDEMIDKPTEEARLLGAIISLGETLKMITVAEGVEYPHQAEGLRMLGCDLGQGFHFCRPLAPESLDGHLRLRETSRDLTQVATGMPDLDADEHLKSDGIASLA